MRFICMLNRTGSNWMCAMLNKFGMDYDAGEWFRPANKRYPYEASRAGIARQWDLLMAGPGFTERRMVVKCNIGQMRRFERFVLRDKYSNRFLFLIRNDVLRQAISQFAMEAGWAKNRTLEVADLDPERVTELVSAFEQRYEDWRNWFRKHKLDMHEVRYEDLVADPKSIMHDVVEYFDGASAAARIPEPFEYPSATKQKSYAFLNEWLEAMRLYASNVEDWRTPLQSD